MWQQKNAGPVHFLYQGEGLSCGVHASIIFCARKRNVSYRRTLVGHSGQEMHTKPRYKNYEPEENSTLTRQPVTPALQFSGEHQAPSVLHWCRSEGAAQLTFIRAA